MGALSIGCGECEYKGWLHFNEPFEIERCDTCAPEGFTDQDAVRKHRVDCGCEWPEVDYQHLIHRALIYDQGEFKDRTLHAMCEQFWLLAEDRENFLENLEGLMDLLGQAIEKYYELDTHDLPPWERPSKYIHNSFEVVSNNLMIVFSLKRQGLWKPHWLWDHLDGEIKDGKWYPKKGAAS